MRFARGNNGDGKRFQILRRVALAEAVARQCLLDEVATECRKEHGRRSRPPVAPNGRLATRTPRGVTVLLPPVQTGGSRTRRHD